MKKYLSICLSIVFLFSFIIILNAGTFTNVQEPMGVNSGVQDSSIAVGDFDNDNDLDIALTGDDGANRFIVYRNDSGTYNYHNEPMVGLGVKESSVIWGDIDNDGDLDLAVAGWAGPGYTLRIYRNDSGAFNLIDEPMTAVNGLRNASIAFGDIDNDGDLDLAVTGNDGSSARFIIFQNNNAGSFFQIQEPKGINQGFAYSSIAFGDIDNDGDLDLAVTGEDDSFVERFIIYTNNSGTFYQGQEPFAVGQGFRWPSIAFGDIDNDGDLDLAITGDDGALLRFIIYQNNAGTYSQIQEPKGLNQGFAYSSIAFGDVDNDGDLDLAATGQDNSLNFRFIIYQNNAGSFSQIQEPMDLNQGFVFPSIAFGDYDNDDDADLIVTGTDGVNRRFVIYQNDEPTGNNSPDISTGMSAAPIGGYWRFSWNQASDDHTPANVLRYQIAIGTNDEWNFEYASESIDLPRGQGNPGKVTVVTGPRPYYQSTIPTTKIAYWKVTAIDTSFKDSGYCDVQTAIPTPVFNLDRVTHNESDYWEWQGPPNPGTSQSNFSPDNDNNADSIVFIVVITNNTWNGGDVEIVIDINKDGLYDSTNDWYTLQGRYGRTNYFGWGGWARNSGKNNWIVPNGAYNVRVRVDNSQDGNMSGNISTNYTDAAPYTAYLYGTMTIIGSSQPSIVYMNTYNGSRQSQPVSNGQTYYVYGLRTETYGTWDLSARNPDLPSVDGKMITGVDDNILDFSSGNYYQDITMSDQGKTIIQGTVYDYLSGDTVGNVRIDFWPDNNDGYNLTGEKTISDYSGFYTDFIRGNGTYNFTVGDSSDQNYIYSIVSGSIYINSNDSPITRDFYVGPPGMVTVQLNPAIGNVNVDVRDPVTGNGISGGQTDPSGQVVLSSLSAGYYLIKVSSYSNTNDNKLYAGITTNISILDGESVFLSLTAQQGYKIYGTIRTNGVGVENVEVTANVTNIDQSYNYPGGRSDSNGDYVILEDSWNNNPYYFLPGTYEMSIGLGSEPSGSPIAGQQKIVTVTTSNIRVDFDVQVMTNIITLVFSNWANYTQGGLMVVAIGFKAGETIGDDTQMFMAPWMGTNTTMMMVPSATNFYNISVMVMQMNGGDGPEAFIAYSVSNLAGTTVYFKEAVTNYSLSGIVIQSNTGDPIPNVEMLVFTHSSQIASFFSTENDGTFNITNIMLPGPYVAVIMGDDSDEYENISYSNLQNNTSATIRLVPIDTYAPVISYLSPLPNGIAIDDDIQFFADDIGLGVDPSSIKIQLTGGAGPGFGVKTVGTGLIYDNGWVYLNDITLDDGSQTIKITVADFAGNTNEITITFELDTTPPLITVVSFTDMNGTHDNVFGNGEWNLDFKVILAGSERGNITIWLDNNKNGVFDFSSDWYLRNYIGDTIKNLTYSNEYTLEFDNNNFWFNDSTGYGYNYNDLTQGEHQLYIELDDTPTVSVNDGHKVVTNLVFYKDSLLPVLNIAESMSINSNTIKITYDSNSFINTINNIEFTGYTVTDTNILDNIILFTVSPLLTPTSSITLFNINVTDKGDNSYMDGGLIISSGIGLPPEIVLKSVGQRKDGSYLVDINYTGYDNNDKICTYNIEEKSTDGSTWTPMTRIGPPSEQFLLNGVDLTYTWDVGTDLFNTEDASVWIRLRVNNATGSNSAIVTNGPFMIDTKPPTVPFGFGGSTAGLSWIRWGWSFPSETFFNQYVVRYWTNGGATNIWTIDDDPLLTNRLTQDTIISNLKNGTEYSAYLTTYDDMSNFSVTPITNFTTATLFPPANLNISWIFYDGIAITWSPGPVDTTYLVYKVQGGTTNLLTRTQGTNEFFSGLAPNTQYGFFIMASNSGGYANNVSTFIQTYTSLPVPVLDYHELKLSQHNVSWQPVGGANGYIVYYGTNIGMGAQWTTNRTTTTSNPGFVPFEYNKTNLVAIIATNANYDSLMGRVTNNFLWVEFYPLSILSTLNVTVNSTNQTVLSWDAVTGESGFIITTNGQGQADKLTMIAPDVTIWTDTSTYKNRNLAYYIVATNQWGSSTWGSNTASYWLPNISVFNAAQLSTNEVIINWTAVNAAGFTIMTNGTGAADIWQVVGSNISVLTDANVLPGETNTYYIQATNYLGATTIWSDMIILLPGLPGVIQNVTILTAGYDYQVLSWNSNPLSDEYVIYTNHSGNTNIMAITSNNVMKISNLAANTEYSYLVRGTNAAGQSPGYSAEARAYTSLLPPGYSYHICLYSKFNLLWLPSTGASGYKISVVTNLATGFQDQFTSSTTNLLDYIPFTYGKTMYVQVMGTNSNYSNIMQYDLNNFFITNFVPISPITGFTATVNAVNETVLSWNDSVGETMYTIYTNSMGTVRTQRAANVTIFTDKNNYANKEMTYNLLAMNGDGGSTVSSVTTSYYLPLITLLNVNQITTNSVQISWSGTNASGYYIWTNGTTPGDVFAVVGFNITVLTDNTVLPNQTNVYYIQGTNYLGNSTIMSDQIITLPSPPGTIQNVTIVSAGNSYQVVTWDNMPSATSYVVYTNQGGQTNIYKITNGTGIKVSGLVPDTEYSYVIRGSNAGGLSAAYSIEARAYTSLVSSSVSSWNSDFSVYNLNWTSVPSATSYNISIGTNLAMGYWFQTNIPGTSFLNYTTFAYGKVNYVKVMAVNANYSNIMDNVQENYVLTNYLSVSPITGFTLNVIATNKVILSWNDPVGETFFLVYTNILGVAAFAMIPLPNITTWTDTRNNKNTNITYYLHANNTHNGQNVNSTIVGGVASFYVPDVLTFNANQIGTTNKVALNWSSTNQTGYIIWTNGTASGDIIAQLVPGTTSYTANTVTLTETNIYYMAATNYLGYSTVSARTVVMSPGLLPPATPAMIFNSVMAYNQIDLTWSDVGNEASYTLFRNIVNNSGSAAIVNGTSTNVTNYNDTSVDPETSYYYWVKAYNAAGESGYSTVTSNTTPKAPPAQPTILVCQPLQPLPQTSMNITWVNALYKTNFVLFRSEDNNFANAISIFGPSTNTNYNDTGLLQNTPYYYWVEAYNSVGTNRSPVNYNTTLLSNYAPVVTNITAAQRKDGSKIVDISFLAKDTNSDTCSYVQTDCEFSTDKVVWYDMTRASGQSDTVSLSNTNISVVFQWDVGVDLLNTELSNAWVRIMLNDGEFDSQPVTNQQAFKIDTYVPRGLYAVAPVHDGTNFSLGVKLVSTSATDANPIEYRFQLAQDDKLSKIDVDSGYLQVVSYSNTTLKLEWEKYYYWKITGRDEFGNETNSSIFTFYVYYPPIDFSRSELRILPNYVGPDDEQTAKIYLGMEGTPADTYKIIVLDLSGRRLVKSFEEKTSRELYDGVEWDLTTENGGSLKNGVYFIYVTGGGKSFKKKFYFRK